MADGGASPGVRFEGVTPILRVRDLAASVAHYVGVLGFRLDWEGPGIFASVSRDECTLFLCEDDQGSSPTWVWIGVADAQRLFEDYKKRGARIRHPPTNYEWAYEMQVEDPDGHVLRMGSEPREGEPVGEWLDMRGERWVRAKGGEGWTRLERG
ncbi:MAG TPA: glyoxalase superfamily protein [Thermoanaerobaculia bacterium]|nr:glyoxalase superfamily protein [Thermoanaerobaculia bacterium]